MRKVWRVSNTDSPGMSYLTDDWSMIEYDKQIARDEYENEAAIIVEEVTFTDEEWEAIENNPGNDFPGW